MPTTTTTVSLAGATAYGLAVDPAAGTATVTVTTFDPTDVAGLRLWLTASPAYCFKDAAGAAPCGDGDPIALWRDRSGHGFDFAQADAASRPVLRADGAGGWYADFDGVTDHMDCPAAPVATPPLSFAARVRPSAAGNRYVVGVRDTDSPADNGYHLRTTPAAVRAMAWAAGTATPSASADTPAPAYAAGAWAGAAAVFSSDASRSAYLNGGQKGTNDVPLAPTAAPTRAGLGYHSDYLGTGYWAGGVRSVLAYAAALTDADVARLAAAGY